MNIKSAEVNDGVLYVYSDDRGKYKVTSFSLNDGVLTVYTSYKTRGVSDMCRLYGDESIIDIDSRHLMKTSFFSKKKYIPPFTVFEYAGLKYKNIATPNWMYIEVPTE